MGNIGSFCCKENGSDADDERILNDNYGSTNDLYNNSSTNSNQDDDSQDSTNNGNENKTLEQTALDKIYQKMTSNVIDVAPGESMVIQQAEYLERQKAYQSKLNQIKTTLPLRLTNRVTKHVDTKLNPSSPSAIGPMGLNSSASGILTSNQQGIIPGIISGNSPHHIAKSQEKRRVEYEPISVDEIQLINDISTRSLKAVQELKINSQEEVVTHFKI